MSETRIVIQIDDSKPFNLDDADFHTILLILERLPSIARFRYIAIMTQLANAREEFEL